MVNRYALTVASRIGALDVHARRNVSEVMSSASAASPESYAAKRWASPA